jgi:hypothetical protein
MEDILYPNFYASGHEPNFFVGQQPFSRDNSHFIIGEKNIIQPPGNPILPGSSTFGSGKMDPFIPVGSAISENLLPLSKANKIQSIKRNTKLSSLTSEERKERRKGQNRVAATRYREKLHARIISMEKKIKILERDKEELRLENERLRLENQELKNCIIRDN